jgi:hypothetical protein
MRALATQETDLDRCDAPATAVGTAAGEGCVLDGQLAPISVELAPAVARMAERAAIRPFVIPSQIGRTWSTTAGRRCQPWRASGGHSHNRAGSWWAGGCGRNYVDTEGNAGPFGSRRRRPAQDDGDRHDKDRWSRGRQSPVVSRSPPGLAGSSARRGSDCGAHRHQERQRTPRRGDAAGPQQFLACESTYRTGVRSSLSGAGRLIHRHTASRPRRALLPSSHAAIAQRRRGARCPTTENAR